MVKLKRLIPQKICLTCDVCCRFLVKFSPLAPLFLPNEITPKIKPYLTKTCRLKLKWGKFIYTCPFFNTANNKCRIYPKRPFDCQLYPFVIMFDGKKEKIILGIDTKCPFIKDDKNGNLIKKYSLKLSELLEEKGNALLIAASPLFIGNFQEDVIKLSTLTTLTKILINNPAKKGFKKLSLKDKSIFDKYFKKIKHPVSSQSFVNLFIWQNLNQIWWKKPNNLDHPNRVGCLAKGGQPTRLKKVSRVKLNLLLETDSAYLDFNTIKKPPDYIYLTKDLLELKGNKYKHKRSAYNYFSKHYKFQYVPYRGNMKTECLRLFSKWTTERKQKFKDIYYHNLLDDTYSAHKTAMENYKELCLIGKVVKINNKICAYTFGFELTKDTFCILLEVCDLKFKGLSEFIFRGFCKELSPYKYINTMDDSGLENLRQSKLSYHPVSVY